MTPVGIHGESGQPDIVIRALARRDYDETLLAMREFTASRSATTPDEIWLVEHPPVFTQGLAGKAQHLLAPGNIPVVATERGGQVTYHGPGQIVAYTLLDLHRRRLQVRELVCRLEQGLIDFLATHDINAVRHAGAPGVYLAGEAAHAGSKIGALGLKISRGRSYHGVALNVAMDLEPFSRINPCGYTGLVVTDMQSVLAARGDPQAIRALTRVTCTSGQGCENDADTQPASVPLPALHELAAGLARCLTQAITAPPQPIPDPEGS